MAHRIHASNGSHTRVKSKYRYAPCQEVIHVGKHSTLHIRGGVNKSGGLKSSSVVPGPVSLYLQYLLMFHTAKTPASLPVAKYRELLSALHTIAFRCIFSDADRKYTRRQDQFIPRPPIMPSSFTDDMKTCAVRGLRSHTAI